MFRRPIASLLRFAPAAAALVVAVACGGLKKTFGVHDAAPAHREPRSTSVLGSWLLATPADSTAFAGARSVELTIQPTTFSIVAAYPTGDAVTIQGTASMTEEGLLTLTPQSGSQRVTSGRLQMTVGRPVTLLTSAAGNSLVFASPQDNTPDPSSVWHKKAAAIQAGTAAAPGAAVKRDSTRP